MGSAPQSFSPDEWQDLLTQSRGGDRTAQAVLFDAVYGELSAIAAYLLRREYGPITLATGDLVNEAVLRLLQSPDIEADDKAHFLSISARVMRQVLIDAGRKRRADKRKRIAVTLTDSGPGAAVKADQTGVQAIETALTRLRVIDPQRAEVVVMRYYGGMTMEEIAVVLGVSESTVKRSWRVTRAWLKDALADDG